MHVSNLIIPLSLFNIGGVKICSEDQLDEEEEYSSNDLEALANADITDIVDKGDMREWCHKIIQEKIEHLMS